MCGRVEERMVATRGPRGNDGSSVRKPLRRVKEHNCNINCLANDEVRKGAASETGANPQANGEGGGTRTSAAIPESSRSDSDQDHPAVAATRREPGWGLPAASEPNAAALGSPGRPATTPTGSTDVDSPGTRTEASPSIKVKTRTQIRDRNKMTAGSSSAGNQGISGDESECGNCCVVMKGIVSFSRRSPRPKSEHEAAAQNKAVMTNNSNNTPDTTDTKTVTAGLSMQERLAAALQKKGQGSSSKDVKQKVTATADKKKETVDTAAAAPSGLSMQEQLAAALQKKGQGSSSKDVKQKVTATADKKKETVDTAAAAPSGLSMREQLAAALKTKGRGSSSKGVAQKVTAAADKKKETVDTAPAAPSGLSMQEQFAAAMKKRAESVGPRPPTGTAGGIIRRTTGEVARMDTSVDFVPPVSHSQGQSLTGSSTPDQGGRSPDLRRGSCGRDAGHDSATFDRNPPIIGTNKTSRLGPKTLKAVAMCPEVSVCT